MQIALPQSRRKARIEIIPLIDIIFFLLATFVMVSMSMVKNQGVPVRLPIAATSTTLDHHKTMILRVGKDGTAFIEKRAVSTEALEDELEIYQKSEPDPRIVIQGDTDAAYGKVIAVLDSARHAGISKVAVQTTKKGS